jgi:REP element-mobilizing transposase RayT
MTRGLKRYYGAHDLHFITCSCYRRLPLLDTPNRRDLLLELLEEVRQRHRFVVLGYVVIPEHFHLLISESQEATPSVVMQVLKQRFAHQVLAQLRKQRSSSPWRREKSGSAASTISMSGQSTSASKNFATCTGIR